MHSRGISASSHVRGESGKDIVDEFLPAIRYLAYKIAKGFHDDQIVEDLVAAGVTGLLEVLQKYDPRRAKLRTFAHLRIRGAMIDELRSMDWFPRSARVKAKRIREVARRLELEKGRQPDEEEMAREMNMDRDEYLAMLQSCGNLSVVSIDEADGEVEKSRDNVLGGVLRDDDNPQEHAEARELRRIVARELEKLPERQRKTLSLYYEEDMNMREVAMALGVTEARVSQLRTQAIASLRPLMGRYLADE
jgi:RNA polymerase sigma factor for flagellar operon FliA